ncbi:MAG: hypothetical protein ACFCAD_27245 [Pleurocapsa sp.]
MTYRSTIFSHPQLRQVCLVSAGISMAFLFNGCGSQQSAQYEATAKASITWRVPYYENDITNDKRPRYEEFESVSLVNVNGQKPEGAVRQDDKGIWWPKEPPRPTVDDIEGGKKKGYEKIGKPEALRQVEYRVKYTQDGERINLPTNHSVYRKVVKSYPDVPLNFTMGINNGSVTKATPVTN